MRSETQRIAGIAGFPLRSNPAFYGLMGIEGNLHQHYYSAWPLIDPALSFAHRVRRPPNNPINCLVSFLNQLTYTVCRHELFKTHLEETFSLLHATAVGRSSLSLDLAEPFKPVLVDVLIFRLVRKRCWITAGSSSTRVFAC